MSSPRKCFYIPTDAHVEGKGFVPSLVTEGEAGHAPLVGSGEFAEPWYWGHTYEEACEHAAKENERLGLTPDDVNDIILSSMSAGAHMPESTCSNCGEDIEYSPDSEPPWTHTETGYSDCIEDNEPNGFHAEPTT